jgi:hypothetical protein
LAKIGQNGLQIGHPENNMQALPSREREYFVLQLTSHLHMLAHRRSVNDARKREIMNTITVRSRQLIFLFFSCSQKHTQKQCLRHQFMTNAKYSIGTTHFCTLRQGAQMIPENANDDQSGVVHVHGIVDGKEVGGVGWCGSTNMYNRRRRGVPPRGRGPLNTGLSHWFLDLL